MHEESCHNDERAALHLLRSFEEIEKRHYSNHRVVQPISHIEHLAPKITAQQTVEKQRRLATENIELNCCKQVVQIREYAGTQMYRDTNS